MGTWPEPALIPSGVQAMTPGVQSPLCLCLQYSLTSVFNLEHRSPIQSWARGTALVTPLSSFCPRTYLTPG